MEEKLQWRTETRRVSDLLPHKKSPRKITKEQMERLKQSFERFNLVEVPAIDTDGTILAGHQRIKVLIALGRGDEMIDVRVPNCKLTDEEAERYMITSNSVRADWDYDLLKGFEPSLLVDLGFDQKELDDIWNQRLMKDEFDVEAELGKIKTPTTKLGDIILLGASKLICRTPAAVDFGFKTRGVSSFQYKLRGNPRVCPFLRNEPRDARQDHFDFILPALRISPRPQDGFHSLAIQRAFGAPRFCAHF